MTEFTIVHITDTHLLAGDGRHLGTDTRAAFSRTLRYLDVIDHVDLVVVSGDVSHDGTEASYRAFLDLAQPWADAHGAPIVHVPGNHDDAATYRAALDPGNPHPKAYRRSEAGPYRVLALDSTVQGADHGRLGDAQLAWVHEELSQPWGAGTIVVVHHPPIAAETPVLKALELRDREAFWSAVDGADVRIVLSGHFHYPIVEFRRGVPVVVASGVTNQSDVLPGPDAEGVRPGSGAAIERIGDMSVRVIPLRTPALETRLSYIHGAALRDDVARLLAR